MLGLGVVDNLDAPIEFYSVVQILLIKYLSLLLRCSSLLLSLVPARLRSGMISLSFGGFVGADGRRFFFVLVLSGEVDRTLVGSVIGRMDTEGHSRLVESFNHDLLFDLKLGQLLMVFARLIVLLLHSVHVSALDSRLVLHLGLLLLHRSLLLPTFYASSCSQLPLPFLLLGDLKVGPALGLKFAALTNVHALLSLHLLFNFHLALGSLSPC